jgi:FlaA1/EpsC-like NDP-sugar epimerase
MGERSRELSILIIGDIIVLNVALWLTLLVRYFEIPSISQLSLHVPPFLIFTSVWLVIFFISGLYDKHTNLLKKSLVSKIISAQTINVIAAGILFFVIPFGITPKTNLVLYLLISTLLLALWRLQVIPLLSPKQRHKAVLIADGAEAVELADEINNNDRYNYYFTRIIDEQTLKNTKNF